MAKTKSKTETEVELKIEPKAESAPEVEVAVAVLSLADIADEDERGLLAGLCAAYRDESGRERSAKNSKDALMVEISPLAGKIGISRGVAKLANGETGPGGWELVQRASSQTAIDPKRLLAAGVSMAVIQAATVKTEKPYYTVVTVGGGGGRGGKGGKGKSRQYGNGSGGGSLLDSLSEADVDFVEGRDGDR